jgi:L-amino acid N-acyltransferase YncA
MELFRGIFRISIVPKLNHMPNFTQPIGKTIYTFPASQGNQISKEYYNHLVGEITRGTILKAVCRIENKIFGVTSYHLISES